MTIETKRSYCCGTLVGWLHHHFVTIFFIVILCWTIILSTIWVLLISFLMIELECSRLGGICMTRCLWSCRLILYSMIWSINYGSGISWRLHVDGSICVFGTVWIICRFISFMSRISSSSSSCRACWTSTNFITAPKISFTCTTE